MKKSKQAGTDFYLALLVWRNTPKGQEHSFQQQQVFWNPWCAKKTP